MALYLRTYGGRQEAPDQSACRVAPPRRAGRKRQAGAVGAAVRRHRATHQRDLRGLKAGTCGQRLAPRVSVSGAGKLLNPGLPGIEPNAPQLAATTASAAGPTLPPRCRSRPATLAPPQDAYQLQLCRARRAISPRFPISPALLHQHHAQPRPRIRVLALSDSGHLHGVTWPDGVYKVGVRPRRWMDTAGRMRR